MEFHFRITEAMRSKSFAKKHQKVMFEVHYYNVAKGNPPLNSMILPANETSRYLMSKVAASPREDTDRFKSNGFPIVSKHPKTTIDDLNKIENNLPRLYCIVLSLWRLLISPSGWKKSPKT